MSQTKAQLIDPVDLSIVTADLADDAVTATKLASNAVVNASVDASAAIAGTKISPDFGSQSVVTTGGLGSGNYTITSATPTITFTDSDNNPDYKLITNGGTFLIHDSTNGTDKIKIQNNAQIDITPNVDFANGIDVTGNITATGDATISGGDLTVTGTNPIVHLTDTNDNSDFQLNVNGGVFQVYDYSNSTGRLAIASTGDHTFSSTAGNASFTFKKANAPVGEQSVTVKFDRNGTVIGGVGGPTQITGASGNDIGIAATNGGNLRFGTGSGGVATNRVSIDNTGDMYIADGDLVISTAGHGIDFSAQTATSASGATTSSELLDHYEEGTFTPFNPSLTASDLQGHYTRIGRVVHCSIYITIPSNSNGNSFVIDGLPFNTFNPDPSVGASLQGGYVIYSNYSAAVLVRTNQGGDRIVVNSIGGNNILLTNLDNINFRIGLHYFTT